MKFEHIQPLTQQQQIDTRLKVICLIDDLTREEQMLMTRLKRSADNKGLQAYIQNIMVVMAFDALHGSSLELA